MSLPQFRSSGDLTADRRYDYAVALLKDGDASAAADLLEQVLDIAPGWPVAWFTLGMARSEAGDTAGAVAALRQTITLDPQDSLGAGLHLAQLGAGETPRETSVAYVRDLFDDYAGRFDEALVVGLGYRAPKLIAAAIRAQAGDRTFARGLDLGCGTGLMAAELGPLGALEGVDLSAGMIAMAREKRLYDALEVGEAVASMRRRETARYDLVTAADVFCYFGDLAPAFGEVARLLMPGGLFAFSVERAVEGEGPDDFHLAESLRFRHNQGAVERMIASAQLMLRSCNVTTLRQDRGIPVTGLIVVAERPASSSP